MTNKVFKYLKMPMCLLFFGAFASACQKMPDWGDWEPGNIIFNVSYSGKDHFTGNICYSCIAKVSRAVDTSFVKKIKCYFLFSESTDYSDGDMVIKTAELCVVPPTWGNKRYGTLLASCGIYAEELKEQTTYYCRVLVTKEGNPVKVYMSDSKTIQFNPGDYDWE